MSMETNPIKPGDVVVLRGGSEKMTVGYVVGSVVKCVYWHDGHYKWREFPANVLSLEPTA